MKPNDFKHRPFAPDTHLGGPSAEVGIRQLGLLRPAAKWPQGRTMFPRQNSRPAISRRFCPGLGAHLQKETVDRFRPKADPPLIHGAVLRVKGGSKSSWCLGYQALGGRW